MEYTSRDALGKNAAFQIFEVRANCLHRFALDHTQQVIAVRAPLLLGDEGLLIVLVQLNLLFVFVVLAHLTFVTAQATFAWTGSVHVARDRRSSGGGLPDARLVSSHSGRTTEGFSSTRTFDVRRSRRTFCFDSRLLGGMHVLVSTFAAFGVRNVAPLFSCFSAGVTDIERF
jgi:hypothetical protein